MKISTILALWFGSGLSPKAPGTAGSLAALPFAYAIHTTIGGEFLMVFAVLIFVIGWWATARYLRAHPEKSDPKEVVIDEVAGQWLLCSVLFPTWQSYLVAFVLFRFYDAVKPWPVSWFDRNVKGAFGVMLDDIVAAAIPLLLFIYIYDADWFSPYLAFLMGQ